MADIELVIKISKEDYNLFCDERFKADGYVNVGKVTYCDGKKIFGGIADAIKNGEF